MNPFPIKQFLVYIVVPFKLLLYFLIILRTFNVLRLLIKGRSKWVFSSKKKECLPLCIEVGVFGPSEILFFSIARFNLIDRKQ